MLLLPGRKIDLASSLRAAAYRWRTALCIRHKPGANVLGIDRRRITGNGALRLDDLCFQQDEIVAPKASTCLSSSKTVGAPFHPLKWHIAGAGWDAVVRIIAMKDKRARLSARLYFDMNAKMASAFASSACKRWRWVSDRAIFVKGLWHRQGEEQCR